MYNAGSHPERGAVGREYVPKDRPMVTSTTPRTAFGYSARAKIAKDQPISYLMAVALARPELISLAAGFVDYHTLPGAEADRMVVPAGE